MPLDDATLTQARYVADLPLAFVRDDPDNPRRNLGDVAAMGESIRQLGVLQPIVVREDPQPDQVILYTVVFGHRRKHGCAHIGRETAPALVIPHGVDIRSPAVLQAAENLARLPMSPIETWRRVQQLQDSMGLGEAQTAAALMIEARVLRRLALLGRVLPAMLEAMEAAGDIPHVQQLGAIAAAHPEEQKAAWKRHGPKKAGQRVDWLAVAGALRRDRIGRKVALFGPELAKKHKIVWEEDLFEQPEDAFHTTHTGRFLAAQEEWLREVCLPGLRLHGYMAELLRPNTWGQAYPPSGATENWNIGDKPLWEPGGVGKDWTRGFWVDPRSGQVKAKAYRPARAEPKPSAGSPGRAAHIAPALPITKRGLERIEEVKRRAAADAVMACTDPEQLLGVALLLLRDRVGSGGPSVAGVLDATGKLDVAAPDFRGRAVAAAHSLLARMIERREANPYSNLSVSRSVVERVGAGLDEVPTWEATEEELALLKSPALKEVATALGMPMHGTGKATRAALLYEHGQDGRVKIGPQHLAGLAWAPAAPSEEELAPGDDGDRLDEAEEGEMEDVA